MDSSLEKELTCSICTEILYQPLTLLDCLHTFCGSCLKEWFASQRLRAERSRTPLAPGEPLVSCPSCRAAVRDTKHNATVATLLEVFLAANPDKDKTEADKAEMRARYRPGENILLDGAATSGGKSDADRRRDEDDRRLVARVREISLVEAGLSQQQQQQQQPQQPRPRRRRDTSQAGGGRESREPSREPRRHDTADRAAAAGSSEGAGSLRPATERRRHHRSGSRQASADSAVAGTNTNTSNNNSNPPRQVPHQASLRSLIGGGADLESPEMQREVAELVRQVQEEGLFDGLDMDDLELSEELSRRLREAYRRRHGPRTRHADGARGSNASHASAVSAVSAMSASSAVGPRAAVSDAYLSDSGSAGGGGPRSSDANLRPTSRQRAGTAHSRSASATSQGGAGVGSGSGDDRSRPPLATSSAHLEVLSGEREQRRRRRTASGGRSATDPVVPHHYHQQPQPQQAARSQTDLATRGAGAAASASTSTDALGIRPAVISASARSSSSPTVFELPGSIGEASSSFSARAAAAGGNATSTPPTLHHHAQQQQQPIIHQLHAGPVELPASRTPEPGPRPRPANIVVPTNASTSGGTASANFAPHSGGTSPKPSSQPPSPSYPPGQQARQAQQRPPLYQEPSIACARCQRPHIEYELHYNCGVCAGGEWNMCLDCYRAGKGCLHWFGFGYGAWTRWAREKEKARLAAVQAATGLDGTGTGGGGATPTMATVAAAVGAANAAANAVARPHMLTANRYQRPRVAPGGADGRRTLTTEDPRRRMESGNFCARCLRWANDCYWRCDSCNEGDWGFCDECVGQGLCCSHALLPLTYLPPAADRRVPPSPTSPPASPRHNNRRTTAPPILPTLPRFASLDPDGAAAAIGPFRPLVFTTACEVCHGDIAPAEDRFHCYSCVGSTAPTSPPVGGEMDDNTPPPDPLPGQYEICRPCYAGLVTSAAAQTPLGHVLRISPENGPGGWRRCLHGHRMAVIGFREGRAGDGGGGGGGGPDAKGPADAITALRRVVVADVVGGWSMKAEPTQDAKFQKWYWFDEHEHRVERLVSVNVADKVPGRSASPHPSPLPSPESSLVGGMAGDSTPPLPSASMVSALSSTSTATPQGGGLVGGVFPPSGGSGKRAIAAWAWYPRKGVEDELLFPKAAEISELSSAYGDWFYGTYMGVNKLVPAAYVRFLEG